MIHKRKLRGENRGIGMTSQGTRDRLVKTLRREGIRDERVLEAITQVPRHEFIDEALSSRAYENTALPIGQRQTISQPWIVARMTELALDADHRERALEIGAVVQALLNRRNRQLVGEGPRPTQARQRHPRRRPDRTGRSR